MRLFGFHVTPVCFSLRVVDFYTVTGCFLYLPRIVGTPLLHQPRIYLSRLISRAFFFSPDTFSPATARRYTILPPHSTHSNGSRFRNWGSAPISSKSLTLSIKTIIYHVVNCYIRTQYFRYHLVGLLPPKDCPNL